MVAACRPVLTFSSDEGKPSSHVAKENGIVQDQYLIDAQRLGKCYRLYDRHFDRLKELASLGRKRLAREFWALQNVSLQVKQGEAWGVVGENGAGKSTLLKLLCGVTLPSQGQLFVHGRIGSLLELGVGFHPEYTGRENLHLSGALMGLSPEELRERIPAILEFAGIGDFVERPLKTYSTGMTVRLAFALATSVVPEILVTDEVLAVGDEAFQKKCIRWMEDFLSNGGTLIFCGHNSYQIKKLCGNALWLQRGEVRASGASYEVVQEYLEYLEAWESKPEKQTDQPEKPSEKLAEDGSKPPLEHGGDAPIMAGENRCAYRVACEPLGENAAVPDGGILARPRDGGSRDWRRETAGCPYRSRPR